MSAGMCVIFAFQTANTSAALKWHVLHHESRHSLVVRGWRLCPA